MDLDPMGSQKKKKRKTKRKGWMGGGGRGRRANARKGESTSAVGGLDFIHFAARCRTRDSAK